MRRTAVATSRTRLFEAVLDSCEDRDRGAPGVFAVLAYHRIGDPDHPSSLDPSLVSATPEAFSAQIAYLRSHRNVLSLDDLLSARRRGDVLPPRSVLVTFDDAYRDFATIAWPILRSHGVPAVLAVPTAYPDRPDRAFWWDRLHAAISGTAQGSLRLPSATLPLRTPVERLWALRWARGRVGALDHERAMAFVDAVEELLGAPRPHGSVLSWEELRRLAREGVAIVSHTRSHPLLHRVAPARLEAEILGSAADLDRELGSPGRAFCYPGGHHTEAAVSCVLRAGYELAFAERRGLNDVRNGDWLRLRRIDIGGHTPLAAIRAQLLGRPGRPRRAGRA
jgi:peptidoglycan/xylan/chitin deacetylase (PgdA/CDA1 family)